MAALEHGRYGNKHTQVTRLPHRDMAGVENRGAQAITYVAITQLCEQQSQRSHMAVPTPFTGELGHQTLLLSGYDEE